MSSPTNLDPSTTAFDLLDFTSVFQFNQRVFTLEQEVSQLKQADKSAPVIESIKTQIPTIILPKKIANFATSLIESTIAESYENVVLAQSSSQPMSTYEATASLTEFELKKILLEKKKKSKSYLAAPEHEELYDGLIKYYGVDKALFDAYGNTYLLKRDRADKDKDEDPSAGSDRGSKKRKTCKEAEPSKKKSPRVLSLQVHQKVLPSLHISQLKPAKPPTPDRDWNKRQSIDFRPPQTWITKIAKDKEPPRSFDELMNTLIDFSEFVMNRPKIENLSQETLVGPAFDLLKGTYKSFVELEYHFEEVYKAMNDRLDWNNPEGNVYPFDLSKPLLLIQDDRGRQVIPMNYFINNDLLYLQGGSASRKYTTYTTKTKADTYDNVQGIEDMVPNLWSPTKVPYDKHALWGVSH
ncbi:hypothetical protein Tco_1247339 [Tanacetum coccineum]